MELKDSLEFRYNYTVNERDLDVFGHVNNARYMEIFELARWDFITKQGFGLDKIKSEKIGPVLLETTIKFRKELRNRDEVIVTSKAIKLDGRFMTLHQKILRDGDVCCKGEYLIALFNLEKRKLINPVPEWLEAIGVK